MDLIFFGMQGAGKGTLGKVVSSKFNMTIFETGAALRQLAQEDSELGKKIKSIIEAGHLVSNGIVMEIVEDFVNKLENDSPILFDGIPRSVEQAKTLNTQFVLSSVSQSVQFRRHESDGVRFSLWFWPHACSAACECIE